MKTKSELDMGEAIVNGWVYDSHAVLHRCCERHGVPVEVDRQHGELHLMVGQGELRRWVPHLTNQDQLLIENWLEMGFN